MRRPIKIATDLSVLPDEVGCHWLLAPLFDRNLATLESDRPYHRIYRKYFRMADRLFSLAALEEADVAMIPADWWQYHGSLSWFSVPNRAAIRRAQAFAKAARRHGKPVVAFFSGERSHERVPLPGAWVLRMSMYRSRAGERDVSIPEVFISDLLDERGPDQPSYRPWSEKPTVGFCGFGRSVRPQEYLRSLGFQAFHLAREKRLGVPPFRGLALRKRAMDALDQSDRIATIFIARQDSFFGKSKIRREALRRDFLYNMMNTDYQLSLRGSANYSHRLWQALSAGRPPLFVDTDCVLPYGDEVDWSSVMVIVDETDMDRLPEAVVDYHSAMDETSYRDLQVRCRDVWERYLSPEGFAAWLQRFWQDRISG